MSIYLTTVNCTYHDSKHFSEETIEKKEDYSCTLYWGIAKFNEGTNAHRFWEFYQLAFLLAYQANSVTWQAYTQLVSTLTKETLTPDDEDLAKRFSLKLVESIRYHYSPEKPVAVTARIIQEVITATTRFVEGRASHTVLAKLKQKEEKDWVSTSIFGSFLGKLGEKGKGYVSVDDPTQVDNLDQTFKVFERRAFDEEIHSLGDTLDILGLLSGRENPKLTWVSRVTKDYNLRSRSQSSKATRIPLLVVQKRKVPKIVVSLSLPLIPPIVPIVPVVLMNRPLILDGDACQTIINTIA